MPVDHDTKVAIVQAVATSVRTTAELSAGVTPVNYGYPPGDVRRYGATGDGSANDTTAVQNAINASAGRVYFPSGTYMVTTLTVDESVLLEGDNATIKQIASTSGDMVSVSGSVDFRMRRMTLDGNQANQASHSSNYILSCANTGSASAPGVVDIEGCTFKNQAVGSLEIDGGASASSNKFLVRVVRNLFLGGADGVASTYSTRMLDVKDTPYVLVDGNTFDIAGASLSVGIAGVVIYGTGTPSDNGRITVVNNTFLGTGRDASDGLGSIDCYSWGKNVVVIGNRLEDVKTRGISIKADASEVVVFSNVINGLTGTNGVAAISCASSVNTNANGRISIFSNVIRNSKFTGISVSGASTGAAIGGNILIDSNLISNIGTGNTSSHYGINVSAVDGASLSHNYVETINPDATANGGVGIRIVDSQGPIKITGNQIRAVAGGGILVTSCASADVVINGNTVHTTTNVASLASRGISVDTATFAHVINNTLTDIEAGESGIRLANTTERCTVRGNVVDGSSTVGFSNGGSNTAMMLESNTFPASAFHALTIASGVVTAWNEYHTIDTESAAASDDLDTINGGRPYQRITIQAANSARTVVMKDGTGNMKLAGDFSLDNAEDSITLVNNGTNWQEVCRSDNGA